MHPDRYFHGDFVWHYAAFEQSLDAHGTLSRMDAHVRENFWGRPLGSPIGPLMACEGRHFSRGDLYPTGDGSGPDHLASIPRGAQPDFVCALFYVVLFDQVVFTHFSELRRTLMHTLGAPKLDFSIGWAGPIVMANPYSILEMFSPEQRGIPAQVMDACFERWARYIPGAMVDFMLLRGMIGEDAYAEECRRITPLDVVQAMMEDRDCTVGRYGAVFERSLRWWAERLRRRGPVVAPDRPSGTKKRVGPSSAARELVCNCCGYTVHDGMLRGRRVYAWGDEEVELVAVPGWCEDCGSLVPVEYTGDADRLVESVQEKFDHAKEWRRIRIRLSGAEDDEIERVELSEWDCKQIVQSMQRLRVIVERRGQERCLECGSRRIAPIEADISLEFCWETGCYVGRKRTGFIHPGCGGEFIVRNAEEGWEGPLVGYVYDSDGRLVRKVTVWKDG